MAITYTERSTRKDVKGDIFVAEGMVPGRKRPMSSTERLTLALQKLDKENPFILALVHAIEKHLQGVTDKSEIDKELEEFSRRHPAVSRKMLQRFVNDYRQVPEQVRMLVTPVQLRNLSVVQKLEMSTFAASVKKLSVRERPTFVVRPWLPGQLRPSPTGPVITRISPLEQYPGRAITVNGNNFVPGKETELVWEPLDFPAPSGMALGARATVRSTTELSVNLPLLVLPGRYPMRVHLTGVGVSDSYTYTIKAPKYRVIFTRFRCIDETNPKSVLFVDEWASDEIVTVWVVAADELLWTKQTDEYGDVDDNDERNYNSNDRVVFMPDGRAGTVRATLAVATKLYEWDAKDTCVVHWLKFRKSFTMLALQEGSANP